MTDKLAATHVVAMYIALIAVCSASAEAEEVKLPKSVIEVSSGLEMGRACSFSASEKMAAKHIRSNTGDMSFSIAELTAAMNAVSNAETVGAYLGLGTNKIATCANVLLMFGKNGTVLKGLLSR